MKIQAKEIVLLDVSKIVENPKNNNIHNKEQFAQLKHIIEFQGFRNPLIISNRSGFLICGHLRLACARDLKLKQVPVIYQDFESEAQEYAYLTADNEIAKQSSLDIEKLKFDLDGLDLGDINLLGLSNDTISKLGIESLHDIKVNAQKEEIEDVVPDNVEPKAKLGQIYQLGEHRLMCGDSTKELDISMLMNENKADIVFTSPPYNAGKTPNGNKQKYLNDSDNKSQIDFKELLNKFTTNCLNYSDYVFSNIQSLAGNKIALIEHLYDLKEKFADTIIWDKKTAEPAMARRVLNSRFEYIHIFSNEAKRTVGKRDFRGTIANIFELNSRQGKEYAKVHKATFPVQLPQYFIENFTESSCLDPFGGTGTTLIACEKTKRKCFMMELDPHYVDVIIKRWEDYSGLKAELIQAP